MQILHIHFIGVQRFYMLRIRKNDYSRHYIMKKNLSEKSVGYKQSVRYLNNYGNLADKAVIEERGRGAHIDEHQPNLQVKELWHYCCCYLTGQITTIGTVAPPHFLYLALREYQPVLLVPPDERSLYSCRFLRMWKAASVLSACCLSKLNTF
jgi:hypothetical protein